MQLPASSTSLANSLDLQIVPDVRRQRRSRFVAGLLGVFLGAFGAHRFYLGYGKLGAAQIAVTVVTAGAGGLWGTIEGWLILCGRPGFDAAGQRLCHQTASHVSAAFGIAISVHVAGVAAYFLGDRTLGRVLPPPQGRNSITISASIASLESAQAPTVEVLPAQPNRSSDDGKPSPTAPTGVKRRPLPPPATPDRPARTEMESKPADPSLLARSQLASRRNLDAPPPVPDHQQEIARQPAPLSPRILKKATLSPADRRPQDAAHSLDAVVQPQSLAPSQNPLPSTDASTASMAKRDPAPQQERPPQTKQIAKAKSQTETLNPNDEFHRPAKKSKPVTDQIATEVSARAAKASNPSRQQQGVKTKAIPTKAFSPNPTYPPELLAGWIEGLVKLRVRVGKDGRVKQASIYRSSGRPQFDKAAMAAIYKWRFEPARRFGFPVESVIAVPVRFSIEKGQDPPE